MRTYPYMFEDDHLIDWLNKELNAPNGRHDPQLIEFIRGELKKRVGSTVFHETRITERSDMEPAGIRWL